MFSEQKNKDPRRKSAKKKPETVDREFDQLEEKVKSGVSNLNISTGGKNSNASNLEQSKSPKKSRDADGASNGSLKEEEKKKDTIGRGLFEAATVMCNIVEITKDSTMKGKGALQNRPVKSGSKSSLTSQSSQSGPFATMKENAQKKKKSVDEEE